MEPRNRRDYRRFSVTFEPDTVCVQRPYSLHQRVPSHRIEVVEIADVSAEVFTSFVLKGHDFSHPPVVGDA